MSLIVIPRDIVLYHDPYFLPPELEHILSGQVWELVVKAYNKGYNESHTCACAIEAGTCILFGFPFIFLCHCCIAKMLEGSRVKTRVNAINRQFYDGRPVLLVAFNGDLRVDIEQVMNRAILPQAMVRVDAPPPVAVAAFADANISYVTVGTSDNVPGGDGAYVDKDHSYRPKGAEVAAYPPSSSSSWPVRPGNGPIALAPATQQLDASATMQQVTTPTKINTSTTTANPYK